jgi:hypothetical protein
MKMEHFIQEMKKKFGEELSSLQVDPITGEYYVTIPEWMINELSWYEDTEINLDLDGKEIIFSEHTRD